MGAALKHDELVQVWESIKATNLSGEVVKGIASKFHISEKVAEASMSVLKKVAACGSFDDFKNYVESNELPALKLTSSEMESVKGGRSVPIIKDILLGGTGPYNPFPKNGI
jgi:hypothetical protein